MLNLNFFGAGAARDKAEAVPGPPTGTVPHAAPGQPEVAINTASRARSTEDDVSSAMDDFIYLVSHDLRASMRALLEVPSWIREDLEASGVALPEPVKEHMVLLDRHTSRLDRMLCDLLALSRVGRMQSVIDADPKATIEQILDEAPLPEGWGLRCDLQHIALRIGEDDVLTLFRALISNAVKHHDRPTGTLTITTSTDGADFVLQVEDDGPGIPPAHRDSVFDVMRTLRPRDQVEGSGMGLALVRKLARIYGGTAIVAARDAGRGTRIDIRIPATGGIVAASHNGASHNGASHNREGQ